MVGFPSAGARYSSKRIFEIKRAGVKQSLSLATERGPVLAIESQVVATSCVPRPAQQCILAEIAIMPGMAARQTKSEALRDGGHHIEPNEIEETERTRPRHAETGYATRMRSA